MLLGEEKLLCQTIQTPFLCADVDRNRELVYLPFYVISVKKS